MTGKPIDLGMTALDELFMTDQERKDSKQPKVQEISLSLIDDMQGHPFKVRRDEDMIALAESIKTHGVITPVILRQKEDGRYECVSGHRRRMAAAEAGHTTIKAEVRNLTRDEAIIIMTHSNRQRSKILPSEKAFAYKMEMEALSRQGKRSDLTSRPVVGKLETADEIGSANEESGRQVQRYIRLTNLIPALLDLVDAEKIAFRPAVELSYLTQEEQENLAYTIGSEEQMPSLAQATKMREFSKAGKLNEDVILSIMSERKPNQKEKYSFKAETIKPFLPSYLRMGEVEAYIVTALKHYKDYQERLKERER